MARMFPCSYRAPASLRPGRVPRLVCATLLCRPGVRLVCRKLAGWFNKAMQMVERPWGIAVHGAASVRVAPDLARVRFKVTRLEQTPSRAFAAATDAVHAVREALRAHQVPDSAVERSRIDLRSMFGSYGPDHKFLGYQCKAAFALQSSNLDDVQDLLVDLVAAGANEIESVEFDVAGKADLRGEARRQAVAAARSKADLYAEAAGVRVGAVLHIEDVDPEHGNIQVLRSAAAGGPTSDDLAPGRVVVSAAVIIGFSISHD
jgi:uncharacterized protein